jgi:LuxR family maltose regulon positive regulatory protein
MATSLLRTKLYIPPVRGSIMPRPRLLERLDAGLGHRLTLISAPAGFGKTTLLAAWITRYRPPGSGIPPPAATREGARPVPPSPPLPVSFAWLSLDQADNDPTRFWAYLVAALRTIRPAIGAGVLAALESHQPPPVESMLAALVNELTESPAPVAIVLDDLHLVSTPAIHEGLVFFLENLLPHTHLVVATRADPPWSLARYRARAEMIELRTGDLRFTLDEASVFLNDILGLELTPDDLAALEARTEGWVAGLQLAALSIQGRQDAAAFVRAFSGSHRFVLDYLVEEVFERQPPGVQDFLLRTSILDLVSGPLCDAVRGPNPCEEGSTSPPPTPSQTILESLERANLFIVPMDDRREWYRYHRLFADLLRSRLQTLLPDEVPLLYRRASDWYAAHEQVPEAVSYALVAGDVESAARLVEEHAFDMIHHGQLATLVGWLEELPAEVVRSWPWLGIASAWAHAYSGQWEGVEALLQDAEQAAQHLPAPSARTCEADHIAGHALAIRAYRRSLDGDPVHGEDLAREALRLLPAADIATRSFAATVLAAMASARGDIAAALQTLTPVAEAGRLSGEVLLTITALSELAAFYVMRGRLHQAAATCEEALQLASTYSQQHGHPPAMVAFVYPRLSAVLYEWNDLEATERYARLGAELCQRWGQPDGLFLNQHQIAATLYAMGHTAEAFQLLGEMKRIAHRALPTYEAFTAALEARWRLAEGNLAAAAQWVQDSGLTPDDDLAMPITPGYRLLARILIAQNKVDEALRLLARLQRLDEACGFGVTLVRDLLIEALAWKLRGEPHHALAVLERALVLAEPEGYVRAFLDEGPQAVELLRAAAGRGMAAGHLPRLLAAAGEGLESERAAGVEQPQPLIEPLSPRELEVLDLLAAGYANKEIANTLVISVGTVKNHLKSIYGKLEVDSRTRAVARARELGLMQERDTPPLGEAR